MLLTLLVESIVPQSTTLWTSSEFMHSKDVSKRIWCPWSSLVRVSLGEHPKDLVDHQMLRRDPTRCQAIPHRPPTSISAMFGEESNP